MRTPSLALLSLSCSAHRTHAPAHVPWRPAPVAAPRADRVQPVVQPRAPSSPRWRCELAQLTLPSAPSDLDIPSASIFADAVVGASLLVRERPVQRVDRVSTFSADLHFRSENTAIDARKIAVGAPMLGAPWRIEDARARVVRRCNAQNECELFALESSIVFPLRVREDAPVFALRIDGAQPWLAIGAVDANAFRGVAQGGAQQRTSGFRSSVPPGHTAAGIIAVDGQVGPIFRRESDQALVDFDGAPLTLDDRPCAAQATEPFAVVVLPIALGTFGPAIELRAEIARDGGESTCVRRLYGRGSFRFVDSSVDVPVRGAALSTGMLRTPRTVHGLRCLANE